MSHHHHPASAGDMEQPAQASVHQLPVDAANIRALKALLYTVESATDRAEVTRFTDYDDMCPAELHIFRQDLDEVQARLQITARQLQMLITRLEEFAA